jgi:hypothetical protein
MPHIEKTVFISYRRKDISWALAIYQYLTTHKYDVFFDYTSIPSGDFEQSILGNIKARAHFLVILTPSALDRCHEPGDWLRREIETALIEKRNIVPLFFDGFSFGTPSISRNLTGEFGMIKRYNGLEIPPGYFEAAMERLCYQYLNVTLDAVIHPIPDEVQKVVREQKIAANEAISRIKEAKEQAGKDSENREQKIVETTQNYLLHDAQQRDPVTARRSLLARILLRERYLTREGLIFRVESLMEYASFGEKSWKDNFYRDMRVVKAALKQAGFDLKYSRTKGKSGYYLAGEDSLHPDVKKEIVGALGEIDQEQIEIYKRIPTAQKFYQACSIINLGKKVSMQGSVHER